MNKAELVSSLAEKTNLTKKDAEKFLKAFEESVTESLINHGKMQLIGFMSLEVSDRPERPGRNPQTGEAMTIPASKTVKFKVGKALKDAVNL
ncbi:MAG: HU family DNA-binding protein [Defluviitaleaceae bacterium]|nr:HU family DNA-binding protein [Defluviitaleaceae bacterium]